MTEYQAGDRVTLRHRDSGFNFPGMYVFEDSYGKLFVRAFAADWSIEDFDTLYPRFFIERE